MRGRSNARGDPDFASRIPTTPVLVFRERQQTLVEEVINRLFFDLLFQFCYFQAETIVEVRVSSKCGVAWRCRQSLARNVSLSFFGLIIRELNCFPFRRGAIRRLSVRDRSGVTLARLEARREAALMRRFSFEENKTAVPKEEVKRIFILLRLTSGGCSLGDVSVRWGVARKAGDVDQWFR